MHSVLSYFVQFLKAPIDCPRALEPLGTVPQFLFRFRPQKKLEERMVGCCVYPTSVTFKTTIHGRDTDEFENEITGKLLVTMAHNM